MKTPCRLRGTSSSLLDGAAVIIFSPSYVFFLAASLVFRVTFHLWSGALTGPREIQPPPLNFFRLVLYPSTFARF